MPSSLRKMYRVLAKVPLDQQPAESSLLKAAAQAASSPSSSPTTTSSIQDHAPVEASTPSPSSTQGVVKYEETISALQFRVRRLETQLTHLIGARRLPGPVVQRSMSARLLQWLTFTGRIMGGVGIVGIWSAALVFVWRRLVR